jgi:hypothetical protein
LLSKGKHAMEVRIDTKTRMGMISGKREVIVDDPAFTRLMDLYAGYRKQNKAPQIAWARRQLLARRFGGEIRPGRPVALTELTEGSGRLPKGYLASVKWYPGSTSLRAVVQVTNPYYGLANAERWTARSSVQLCVCASGADEDISWFNVSHEPGGKTYVYYRDYSLNESVTGTAKWKSFDGGYVVDADLPYSAIQSFDKAWTRMAVSATVSAAGPDCRYGRVSAAGLSHLYSYSSVRSYRLLTRK